MLRRRLHRAARHAALLDRPAAVSRTSGTVSSSGGFADHFDQLDGRPMRQTVQVHEACQPCDRCLEGGRSRFSRRSQRSEALADASHHVGKVVDAFSVEVEVLRVRRAAVERLDQFDLGRSRPERFS